jgi:predicted SAM-dependent methyltransferase
MGLIRKILGGFLSRDNHVSRYSLKLKREYRVRSFNRHREKVLEICGGRTPLSPDNLNVDIVDHPTVDVIADISRKLPFDDKEIDKIISIATLEHFGPLQLKAVLREFYRILREGGRLEIGVPSLEKIFKYYQHNGCDDFAVRFLHGAQKDQYDVHLFVVDYKRFKKELEEVGFKDICETDYDYPFHSREMMMKITALK